MQLDIVTLTLVFTFVSITSALVMFMIWRINPDMSGVFFWMLSSLLFALSALILVVAAQFPIAPGWGPFLSNSVSLPANMLLMEGALRFRGYFSRLRWNLLLGLIPVFVALSWLNRFDPAARYLVHDSIVVSFMLVAAFSFVWRVGSREQRSAYSLAFAGGLLMTLPPAVRGVMATTGNESVMAGTGSFATQYYMFFGLITYIFWIFGLTVACYYRSRQRAMLLARKDALTGLPNRRWLDEYMQRTLAECNRGGERFALVMVDINGFKWVNDRHGHSVGDRLLQVFAERLQSAVREADFVGRQAGDEFLVFLRQLDAAESAKSLVERLRTRLDGPVDLEGCTVPLVTSLGVALFPQDATSTDRLLTLADQRMYQDKREKSRAQAGRVATNPAFDT